MNTKTIIRLLILASLLVLLFAGCDLFGDKVSIRDRISRFQSDLNNNRANAYTHLHKDSVDKPALRDGTTGWPAVGFSTGTHTIAITGVSGSNATGTIEGGVYLAPTPISFGMKEEGKDNWYIRTITIDGTLRVR